MRNPFGHSKHKVVHSLEEWGENEKGYFSFESGTFIEKDEVGMFMEPEVTISWPGEVEKKERDKG